MYRLRRLLDMVEQMAARRTFTTAAETLRHERAPANNAVFRCDAERDVQHHLRVAQELARLGVRATMYFHTRRDGFVPDVLRQIRDLGHEVSYHHECLDRCAGDFAAARELFLREVALFREHGFELNTVCSHGEAGLPRDGFQHNWDLFLRYPDLLREAGVESEMYLWLRDQAHQIYASDVFVSYRRFWPRIDQARQSDQPIMILVHLHRWHEGLAPTGAQVLRDVGQHLSNRVRRRRTYELAY